MFCKTFDLTTAQVLLLKEQPTAFAPGWKLTQVTEVSPFARYHHRKIFDTQKELNEAFEAYDKADAILFFESVLKMNQ